MPQLQTQGLQAFIKVGLDGNSRAVLRKKRDSPQGRVAPRLKLSYVSPPELCCRLSVLSAPLVATPTKGASLSLWQPILVF